MAYVFEDEEQPAGRFVFEDEPDPQPEDQGGFMQGAGNLAAGAIRGAGSIGATILYPWDKAQDIYYGDRERNIAGLITGDQPLSRNEQRRAAIDTGLREMGAQPESLMYQGGKLAGEIAGTAGIGVTLARGAMLGAKVAPTIAPQIAAALQSGGMTAAGGGIGTRLAGGAVSGAAMGGMINPEDAGTGAVIGGAIPIAGKLAGLAGQKMRGAVQSPEVLQAIKEARDLGYVIPPTQAKPTIANRLLEGFAGKLTTAQNASARNAEITNALAAKAIGLPDGVQITPEVLKDLRKTAGAAYESIGNAGTIVPTNKYSQTLDTIAAPFIKTAKSFPDAKPSPVIDLIESLKSPSFDSAAAVEKIKQLRTAADDAFRSGNTDVARASKAAAGALEDAVETHLQSIKSPKLLQDFRDARQFIAKTYTVEKALNPTTGSIDAKKLGALIKRGKPLTGELKQAGEFANRFPKAAQSIEGMGSLPQSSPLDWTAAGLGSFMAGNPLPMAGVLARPAARKLTLSDLVQNRLTVQPSGQNRLAELLQNPAFRALPQAVQSR